MEEIFYKIIALVIMAVFYTCYFAKMVSQKKKGIQTDQMGKDKKGITGVIEILLKTVTFLVPVAEAVSIFLIGTASPAWLRIAGIILGIMGDAVFILSVATMKDSWRAGVSHKDKTELITDGIYRFSRNPAFLGFDMVYLGILYMFFNWGLFLISAFAALMFHLQIVNVEEPFLLDAFKDEYVEYQKHVNRYLGRK